MPYSSDEGKRWMCKRIWVALATAPARHEDGHRLAPRVLDVGAGSGTYADLIASEQACMRTWMPHLTAVEVHAPYVDRFGLRRKYDEVIIGDARAVAFPAADVVILGDVLEHMPAADAHAVWAKARAAASTAVLASLPIVEWPQGESEGNPHEAHVETWSDARVMAELPGIAARWVGGRIGCYRAEPLAVASAERAA